MIAQADSAVVRWPSSSLGLGFLPCHMRSDACLVTYPLTTFENNCGLSLENLEMPQIPGGVIVAHPEHTPTPPTPQHHPGDFKQPGEEL